MADQVQEGYNDLTRKGKENYTKILEYLSDPDLDWPKRRHYSTIILNYKRSRQIYRLLTPKLLTEIEDRAAENRQARCARQRSIVRQKLYERAKGYSHDAVKILKNKVKSIDKEGIVTEKTEPMYVPYVKHYPPDPVSGREFLDRTEGKVKEKHEHDINPGDGVSIEVVVKGGDL